MGYNSKLAAEVRAEIARQGMSREDVWRRVAALPENTTSRSTWHRMVKGEPQQPFDLDALDVTANVLGTSVGHLLVRVGGLDLRARRDSNSQPSDPKVLPTPVAA